MALRDKRPIRLIRAMTDRYAHDSGGYMSAAIAYYGFLSLFPLLLLGLSVAGFVLAGRPDLQQRVADEIAASVPGLSSLIGENLDRLIQARAGAGILGLVTLLWTGTGVAGAARNALRRVFRQPLPQGIVEDKVLLVLKTAALGVLALVATALAGWAGSIEVEGALGVAVVILVALAVLALDFALFLVTYRILMRERPRWGRLVPGAVLAAVGWTVLKMVGAWYANLTVGNASAVYGTFATTVGVLVLLYLAARLFVYGAELNAVLMEEGGSPMGTERGDGDPALRRPPQDRSTGELVRSIGSDTVTLVRKEVELAKQEIKEGIMARVMGAGALGAAGVMGLFVLGFLGAAGAAGLALVLDRWLALLVVAGGFVVLALAGLVVGRAMMKGATVAPERARQNIKEDVAWARAQLKR